MNRTITILTTTFILFLSGVVNSQEFLNRDGSSLYPSVSAGNYIPPSNDYALLQWRLEPALNTPTSDQRIVTSASIVNRVDYHSGFHASSVGWYESTEQDYSIVYTIIDAEHIYYRSGSGISSRYLSEIQNILTSKGLGTVEQRQNFISFQRFGFISPPDFRSYLVPFIIAGIVVFLTFPFFKYIKRVFRR